MKKFRLIFDDPILEKQYQNSLLDNNRFPAKKLLFFNIFFHFTIGMLSLKNTQSPLITILALGNILIFLTFFIIYIKAKSSKILYQHLYVFFSILVPFVVFSGMLLKEMEEGKMGSGIALADYFILGFCFKMYISHIYLFKMSWISVIFIKLFVLGYIISFDLEETLPKLADSSIILIVLTTSSFIFDFQKEKNDRNNFYTEYLLNEHSQNFKQILEEIPDQVIIWQKKGLTFANKATFELFKKGNLTSLEPILLTHIDIQDMELETVHDEESKTQVLSMNFSSKIKKLLNMKTNLFDFQNFVAHIKLNDSKIENPKTDEFDIRIKRIYWEKEVSLMMLMNKVSEKNIKARLDFVNSFLTHVLGNISHEMNTPNHILLGVISDVLTKIPNFSMLREIKIMQASAEILQAMIRIMVDLFNIRKGCLYLVISQINMIDEIQDVLQIFQEMMTLKKIQVTIDSKIQNIYTDLTRFKQILIFLLNKVLPKMAFGNIKFNVTPGNEPNFYKFSLEFLGEIDFFELSPYTNSMMKHCSSPFMSAKLKENYPDSEFSLIDCLVLCLSIGKSETLETRKENKNILENSTTFSNIVYNFQIWDVNKYEKVKLKDPFKEKNNFKIKFEKIASSCTDAKEIFLERRTKNEIIYRSNTSIKEIPFANIIDNNITNSNIFHQSTNETTNLFSKFHVLNVDDLLFSLMVISNYCHSHNVRVSEAKNGLEAYEMVEKLYKDEQRMFDLIFMDCDMPLMNGFDASKKINEFCGDHKLKCTILAITANVTNEEIIQDCRNSGMAELIQKPLSCRKFKEVLEKYLKN